MVLEPQRHRETQKRKALLDPTDSIRFILCIPSKSLPRVAQLRFLSLLQLNGAVVRCVFESLWVHSPKLASA